MPYYDVKCNSCNKLYENLKLSYKEFDEFKCKECGGKTSRYWGGENTTGIVFKCGGFADGYSSKKTATKKTEI